MKSSTIRMLRAYLLVASLGAVCIDACVVIAMLVFDIPARVFTSGDFRIAMAASLLLLVLAARSAAQCAFNAALASRHARVDGARGNGEVALRDDCPYRPLVLLHVRIHRQGLTLMPS
ncbi:hypothetical protein HUS70_00475 [Pandoraea nosoerga]|uniref:Uncharacterized protein n=1 Tax=Pandoraea nosoerga TaxID=2508296 RepID=A0A5E4RJD2_9BURK|nr:MULTISPECIES: hypothetical protein [Pandoraea]MBN4664486.1 hypothetical protein [Pandoraea nosoerga]MBN4674478.1 hypothetical protein [Pandoraea nosoerga]MBN4679746.1 hypothetical protein [Pandoraea nosoerga]MBN4743166.1 hypothetical protein [Pandoraea nosoerga]VVD63386.1 hypothetical protein PNO31109_00215 [Pandoraea nosoerga]